MLKLEAIYHGKSWGVYRLPDSLADLLPEKSEKEISEEGYLQWEPGCAYPPSVRCNGVPYGKEGVNPPPTFLPIAEECPPGFREVTFFRPLQTTEIHLYFQVEYIDAAINLKTGSLYVPLQHLFQSPENGEKPDIVVELTNLRGFLEELERWDVRPTAVLHYSSSSVQIWTERGIPYRLYWRECPFRTVHLELKKVTVGAETSLPLFLKSKDFYNSDLLYVQTNEGLHYAFRKNFRLTAAQVTECFGFSCNQPAEVERVNSWVNDRYYLPVSPVGMIAGVKAKEPIKLLWSQSGWGLRAQPESLDELVLHAPKLMDGERFGLVNAPTKGLNEMLKQSGLVKLNKRILAGGREYTLYYISQGTLQRLPGKYAFVDETYRSSYLPKKEKKEYENLCSSLTYLLPGKAYYWSMEDLKRYDTLLRSGRYATERLVTAGSQRWKILDEDARRMWIQQNRYVTFTPLTVRTEQVTLWEIISLEELLHWLAGQAPETPNEYQLQRVLFYLASKGVHLPVLVECLSSYYGLSAVETALISSHVANPEQK